ncbi:chaperone -like [Chlorella sorokiniana]|uniref:Chaperone-like n=1 Tax=Chlorella sorokiniana TaxID=3076 RepID=A0A2P6TTX5_CHLSO|nr:chaperone -like [Chlorella sorokiniana]|eukprot:PRW57520.1 chaperone -like [Chlorella sorokiniana]
MLASARAPPASAALPARAPDRLAPLRRRLQRLAASQQPAQQAAQQQQQGEQQSFVSEEERHTLSASQIEFLERKRRAAAGLGPLFPDCCTCEQCGGSGAAPCHQCNGTGVNDGDKAAELFQNERNEIIQRNGLADNRWFFQADAPCWLCRGGKTLGCPDCGGSGMRSRSGFVAD